MVEQAFWVYDGTIAGFDYMILRSPSLNNDLMPQKCPLTPSPHCLRATTTTL